ncbi:MAG: hypothetical protein JRE23_15545 [Deltaproteobacteria bacterium]|nr:hypothetical protein [Deltaproteobacteria bacterium]
MAWTQERKDAASKRMKEQNAAKKTAEKRENIRVPIGAQRDITNVHDTPKGFIDRWVNDDGSRVEKFKAAGYEMVDAAKMASTVDGSHAQNGVVSKDMGKGVTAYLMRQRDEYYSEDQSKKQKIVDRTEESMRRKKVNAQDSTDGNYGEVKIG